MCSGQARLGPLAEVTEDDFDALFNVNAKSALFGIQAVANAMQERGIKGSILVNSSVTSMRVVTATATPPASVYSASKAAADTLTKHAAVEYASAGAVNAVPGPRSWSNACCLAGRLSPCGRRRYAALMCTNQVLPCTACPSDAT